MTLHERVIAQPIDLVGNEIRNFLLQNLGTAPGTPAEGQVYFDTVAKAPKVWDGTTWQTVGYGTTAATATTEGVVQLDGDFGGTASSPTVVGTHLATPLPLAQGGTNAATASAARVQLVAAQSGANADITALSALTGTITHTAGTITADTPVLSATQTWNNVATTFEVIKANITNTAANGSSTLLDLQVGGASQVKVDHGGNATLAGNLAINGGEITTSASALWINANTTIGFVPVPSQFALTVGYSGTLGVLALEGGTTAGAGATAYNFKNDSQMNVAAATTASALYGAFTNHFMQGSNATTSVVTAIYGAYIQISIDKGLATTAYGLYVDAPALTTGATIGTNYAAYFNGNVEVAGNLTVTGEIQYTDATHINVGDQYVNLNDEIASHTANTDGGFHVKRYKSDDSATRTTAFYWNESNKQFQADVTDSTGDTLNTALRVALHVHATISGTGSATSWTVTHNLNNQYPAVSVYDATTLAQVDVDVVATSASSLTINMNPAPSSGQNYIVAISG